MPFSDQSGIGAIELGLRWAELSFDSDNPVNLFSSSLSPVNIPGGGTTATNGAQSLTVGLNWYFNEWTRAMLNWNYYGMTILLGPVQLSIGLMLGRTAAYRCSRVVGNPLAATDLVLDYTRPCARRAARARASSPANPLPIYHVHSVSWRTLETVGDAHHH